MRLRTLILIATLFAACIAAVVLAATRPWITTTLEVTVRDAVSSSWVWGVTAALQNRTAIGFLTTRLRLSHLRPGAATLEVTAPAYATVSVPVQLRRGANALPEPILLTGHEIPRLASFACFEQSTPGELTVDLQPMDAERTAIVHHPVLDLRVGCIVSAQRLGSGYARETTVDEPERGEVLFRGPMEWRWNDAPDAITRYQARLPVRSVQPSPASYWFVDYVVIVPDPRAITPQETEALLRTALAIPRVSERSRFLASLMPRARGFDIPAWNVRVPD